MGVRRFALGLVMIAASSSAAAQSFNQELTRLRATRFECAATYQRRIERACDAACQAAAATRRDRCLAAAERRYQAVLRRELRIER